MKSLCTTYYEDLKQHYIEIYYAKPGDYMLMVDGAFYAKYDSLEAATNAANRTAEWFGWRQHNPFIA